KDRSRRYETASGLARDLEHYLADEPVEACPPSLSYRARKLLRRHRRLVATVAGAALLLSVAGFLAYRGQRLERQRLAEQHQHEQQLLAEKRQNALDKAMMVAMSGDLDAANKAIADAELLGASAGEIRMLRGQLAVYRQDPAEGLPHLQQAVLLLPES